MRFVVAIHAAVFLLASLVLPGKFPERKALSLAMPVCILDMVSWLALQRVAAVGGLGVAAALVSGLGVVYCLMLSRFLLRRRVRTITVLGALLITAGVAYSGPSATALPNLAAMGMKGCTALLAAFGLSGLALSGKEALLRGDASSGRQPMTVTAVAALACVAQLIAFAAPQVASLRSLPGLSSLGTLLIGPVPQLGALSGSALAYIAGSGFLRLSLAWGLRAADAPTVQLVNAVAIPFGAVLLAMLEPPPAASIREMLSRVSPPVFAALGLCLVGSVVFFSRLPRKAIATEVKVQGAKQAPPAALPWGQFSDAERREEEERIRQEKEKEAAEEKQRKEKRKQQEEQKIEDERKKREEQKKEDERKKHEEEKLKEQKAEQQRMQDEKTRKEEERRRQEEQVLLENQKIEEERRRVQEREQLELDTQEKQNTEERKRLEEQRKAEKEEQRRLEEQKKREEQERLERQKKEEESKQLEKQNEEEQKRLAEQRKEEDEKRKQEKAAAREKSRKERLNFKWKMQDEMSTAKEVDKVQGELGEREEELSKAQAEKKAREERRKQRLAFKWKMEDETNTAQEADRVQGELSEREDELLKAQTKNERLNEEKEDADKVKRVLLNQAEKEEKESDEASGDPPKSSSSNTSLGSLWDPNRKPRKSGVYTPWN